MSNDSSDEEHDQIVHGQIEGEMGSSDGDDELGHLVDDSEGDDEEVEEMESMEEDKLDASAGHEGELDDGEG